MKTLAIYLRISNDDDNIGESSSIQNQRDLIHEFIRNKSEFKDWRIVEYLDDGISGTTFNRKGVQEMLSLCSKSIDAVVVKDFSRFGRNLVEVGHYLDNIFPFLGVRFLSVTDLFDSADNKGKTIGLDISLKAMVYEMYSRDLSQKVTSVKTAKMLTGEFIGGNTTIYGYEKAKNEKHKLVIDKESANVVQRIFKLAESGCLAREIAVILNNDGVLSPLQYKLSKGANIKIATAYENNLWNYGNVRRIIEDERYTGVFIGKKEKRIDISTHKKMKLPKEDWIKVENAHEPIISKEIYDNAQKIFAKNKKHKKRGGKDLFSGFIRCQACNHMFNKSDSKKPYYRCITKNHNVNSGCSTLKLDKDMLTDILTNSLNTELNRINLTNDNLDEEKAAKSRTVIIKEKLQVLSCEIKKCKSEKIKLYEEYKNKLISKEEFVEQKSKSTNELLENENTANALTEELNNLKSQTNSTFENQNANVRQYRNFTELTRPMLEELLHEIKVFSDDTIEIIWKFKSKLAGNNKTNIDR